MPPDAVSEIYWNVFTKIGYQILTIIFILLHYVYLRYKNHSISVNCIFISFVAIQIASLCITYSVNSQFSTSIYNMRFSEIIFSLFFTYSLYLFLLKKRKFKLFLSISFLVSIFLYAPINVLYSFGFNGQEISKVQNSENLIALAGKAKINESDIYVGWDQSLAFDSANARVFGWPSRKILLSDKFFSSTSGNNFNKGSVNFILAHEIHHYKNNDPIKIFLFFVSLIIILCLLIFMIDKSRSFNKMTKFYLFIIAIYTSIITFPMFQNIVLKEMEKSADLYAANLLLNQSLVTSYFYNSAKNERFSYPIWYEFLFLNHYQPKNRIKAIKKWQRENEI